MYRFICITDLIFIYLLFFNLFFFFLLLAERATIHKNQTTIASEASSNKSKSNISSIIHFAIAREASPTILFFLCERSELIDE